jgi:hypothetical protein
MKRKKTNYLEYRFPLYSDYSKARIVRRVLKYGDLAEILQPRDLIDKWLESIENMYNDFVTANKWHKNKKDKFKTGQAKDDDVDE